MQNKDSIAPLYEYATPQRFLGEHLYCTTLP
jgi:hypothetical protein